MKDFTALIKAQLDAATLSEVEKKIKGLENTKITLGKITIGKIDTVSLKRQIEDSLKGTTISTNNIKVSGDIGKQVANSVVKGYDSAIKALDTGKTSSTIATLNAQFQRLQSTVNGMSGNSGKALGSSIDKLKSDFSQLNKLQSEFAAMNRSDTEGIAAKYKEVDTAILQVKNSMKAVTAETKQYASSLDVSKLQSKMQTWLQQNPRAAKQYGQSIKALSSELAQLSATEGVTTQRSRQVAQSFEEIKMSAQAAGLTGRSFGSSLQAAFQSLTRYVGISTLIYRGIATLRQGIRDVVDLDTALVDLQKTAKATREELSSFYYDANEQAKEFGVTTKEIIQSTANWSRLGLQ